MDCHEKLMAKKKKYDAKKKQQQAQLQREKEEREQREREMQLDESRKSNNSSRNSILQSYLSSNGSNTNLGEAPSSTTTTSSTAANNTTITNTTTATSSTASDIYSQTNKSSNSVLLKKKILPNPPTVSGATSGATSATATRGSSDYSHYKEPLVSPQKTRELTTLVPPDNDFSIEEVVNDSDDDDNIANRPSLRPQKDVASSSLLHRRSPPPFLDDEGTQLQKLSTPPFNTPPSHSRQDSKASEYTDAASSNVGAPGSDIPTLKDAELQPAVDIIVKDSEQRTPEMSNTLPVSPSFKPKNLMILSPNQYHDHEFHTTNIESEPLNADVKSDAKSGSPAPTNSTGSIKSNTLSALGDDPRARSGCTSPFAKANRQARVVETNDYIETEGLEDVDYNTILLTPQKRTPSSVTSPPPKAPLPSTPTRRDDNPKGLGLEGINYGDGQDEQRSYLKQQQEKRHRASDDDMTLTPSHNAIHHSPRKSYGSNDAIDGLEQSGTSTLLRMNTLIKTPKLSLKHKRSISGGSTSSGKFGFFKSNKEEKDKEGKGHSRHVSEGSVSNGAAYTTPPLPISTPQSYGATFREHTRSTSDTPFLTSLDSHHDENENFDLKTLKFEISQLSGQKSSLNGECRRLATEKSKLNEQVKSLNAKVQNETSRLNKLLSDIDELEAQKLKLAEYNNQLLDQNRKLELSLDQNRKLETPSDSYSSSYTRVSNDTEYIPNNTTIIGGVHFTELPDESAETNRATRLKFWRRAKNAAPNLVQTSLPGGQSASSQPLAGSNSSQLLGQSGYLYNGSSKVSQNYSSQAIRLPNHSLNGLVDGAINQDKKRFTRSRSTNIIDTLLSNGDSETPNVPLFSSTIQQRADFENVEVPLIITKCLVEVEMRGLDMEGIYRISGGNSAIVAIENAFSNIGASPALDEKQLLKLQEAMSGDINAVTSALKRYFRKLPDPLIPYAIYDDFIKVSSGGNTKVEKKVADLKKVASKLPNANKHTLYLLCKHLSLVSSFANLNRMNYKNLSVVFAPTIARDETGQKEMIDMGHRNETTELMLNHWEKVFDDMIED